MLPNDKKLNIHLLNKVFDNTVATYKFYWFLSILDIVVKKNQTKISFWEIIAGMISLSWYPIHYYKISFGKLDSIYQQSYSLQNHFNINIDEDKNNIEKFILDNLDKTKDLLLVFSHNVPYRFLSPWIKWKSNADVELKSQYFENNCLYKIENDAIEINPIWKDYICEHYTILRDFSYWNLTLFLQKRNPNVPDLNSKLIKPISRNSLTKQLLFWNSFIESNEFMQCIYTGKKLTSQKSSYHLDHFIPWSFVSHDLLWNLLPIDPSINSSKSNNLPPLDIFIKPFASQHQKALQILYPKNPNNKIFEDYLTLYDSVSDLAFLSEEDFILVFKKTIYPLAQIAENMGFNTWKNHPNL